MQAFLQSAFLQALAYSLLASIWQMALLWLITIALLKLFKLSSAQKFNIAFTAQLAGFAFFIYTCVNAYQTGAGKLIIDTTNTDLISGINSIANTVMPYAAILYLSILLFKVAKLAFIFNDTLALKKNQLIKMPAEQRIFVQQMTEAFSLHKKVKIYLSEKVICPLTTGFFKPVILIPVAAVNHLTTEQMEAVILHELAHIKRADYLLYILQSIIEKIFFFNVFSGMLSEIIERERENACDDWVLQFRYNSMHYAEALFKLGRLKALPAIAMALQGKKDSLLLMRIKRLLRNPQRNPYNIKPVLSGVLCMFICAVLLLKASAPKISINQPQENTYVSNVVQFNPTVNNKPAVENKKQASVTIAYTNKIKSRSVETRPIEEALPVAAVKAEVKPEVINKVIINGPENNVLQLKQNYVYKVKQSLDSFKLAALPQFNQAVATQTQVTADMMQKIISYQNFKQLESMLEATGDSISVIENKLSKNSYKKQITIESFDKQGNKHIYEVIVELYQ